MNFTVEPNEAAFIVQVIGNLPTQSNAHPLWVKLSQQLQEQQQPVQEQPNGS
jgi:hypothetical protein